MPVSSQTVLYMFEALPENAEYETVFHTTPLKDVRITLHETQTSQDVSVTMNQDDTSTENTYGNYILACIRPLGIFFVLKTCKLAAL